ncbi:hypothetical protein ACFYE8_33165 [Rhizobium leguminosarum]|uniref:hypothetical protein n=1 Tax=Rhizobium leguminosarum TaxID=384 RepID=UPI0036DDDCD7
MADEKRYDFGRVVGDYQFAQVSEIKKLRFKSGSFIDRIVINDNGYGGDGGTLSPEFEFGDIETIQELTIASGGVIDRFSFVTSNGRNMSVGGPNGDSKTIRGKVTGIAGEVGHYPGGPKVVCRLYVWMIPRLGYENQ